MHGIFVFVVVWFLVNLACIPWLFATNSGWSTVNQQTWPARLLLLIPFSSAWKNRVPPPDELAVARWRRRVQAWYFGLLVLPMFAFFAFMWSRWLTSA